MTVLSLLCLFLAACGKTDEAAPATDPHAGHTMPAPPAAPAADPHAGHTKPADGDMAMPMPVTPGAAAAIGLRTAPAREGASAPRHRAPASATFDPSRTRRVTVTAGGQLREERVPRVGEPVRSGQVLARIWLPEISAAFEELAVARPLGEPWASAARSRLLALGVPAADIDRVGTGGVGTDGVGTNGRASGVPTTWTVRAPVSGIVVSRPAREGTWLGPGGLVAEIAAADARVIEMVTPAPPPIGTPVNLSDGTGTWEATVSEVLPTAGSAGRSVRLLPKDPLGGDIGVGRPLTATWEGTPTTGVWVPRGAVVDTGTRQLVFVAGPEGYTPRPVSLGVRTADEVQITAGLAPGEEVVAAGTFLFDSETQMQGGGHAGHVAPEGEG